MTKDKQKDEGAAQVVAPLTEKPTPPDGMRLVECNWPEFQDAYLFVPKTWLMMHVDAYFIAKEACQFAWRNAEQSKNGAVNPQEHMRNNMVQQAACALSLINDGLIEAYNVPGAHDLDYDITQLPAPVMGWLRTNVSRAIEATQGDPLAYLAAFARGGTM